MTYSETKFREYLKKQLDDPNIYIKKLPDKKQGNTSNIGMPDYLCITKKRTLWFEVKLSHTKSTFNLNEVSESQYIEFDKMHNAGAKIFIAIYVEKELFIVPYVNVRFAKFSTNDKSVNLQTLNAWRVKDGFNN